MRLKFFHKKTEQTVAVANPFGFCVAEGFPESAAEGVGGTPADTPKGGFAVQKPLVCAVKAFIIFAAALGTLGGLLSSFDIAYNLPLVAAFLALFSVTIAFIYYSKWVLNLFFPVVFIIYAVSIMQNRLYVNSGYQGFLNIIREAYGEHFNLPMIREAAETYADRYLTITMAAIYIGFFLIVLLNIAISTHMNLPLVALLTFPILQLGLYIGRSPDLFFYFCLIFCYVAVGVIGRTRHYSLPVRGQKKKRAASSAQSERKKKQASPFTQKKKNGILYSSYKTQGSALLQLAIFALAASVVFMGLTFSLLSPDTLRASTNRLKTHVDEMVKIFLIDGWEGLFGINVNRGGMSNGDLRGSGAVRPNYDTHLKVRFVPYDTNPVYLRGFIGSHYEDSMWTSPAYDYNYLLDYLYSEEDLSAAGISPFANSREAFEQGLEVEPWNTQYSGDDGDRYEHFTAFLEENRLRQYMAAAEPAITLTAKMEVDNVAASQNYLYLPYYTSPDFGYPDFEPIIFSLDVDPERWADTLRFFERPYMVYNSVISPTYLPRLSSELDLPEDSEAVDTLELDFIPYSPNWWRFPPEEGIFFPLLNGNFVSMWTYAEWDDMSWSFLSDYHFIINRVYEWTFRLPYNVHAAVYDTKDEIDALYPPRMAEAVLAAEEAYDAAFDAYHGAVANYEFGAGDDISTWAQLSEARTAARDELYEIRLAAWWEDIERVQRYFLDHFVYSTSPGRTPASEDFVSYFLTEQRQGYCSHFASAATLLYRAYGIPARYVEGYVITQSDIIEARVVEGEDAADWLMADNVPGLRSADVVMEVEVPDARAHAWVEVYHDSFGWIPIEVTPPSDEEMPIGNFWGLLGALFSLGTGGDSGAGETVAVAEDALNAFALSTDFLTRPLLMVMGACAALAIVALPAGWVKKYVLLAWNYHKGRYDLVLPHYYRKLVRMIRRDDRPRSPACQGDGSLDTLGNFPEAALPKNPLPCEVAAVLKSCQVNRPHDTFDNIAEALAVLERCCYAETMPEKAEAKAAIAAMNRWRRLAGQMQGAQTQEGASH